MWRCLKCGELHEDPFTACWKCGTSKVDVDDPSLEHFKNARTTSTAPSIRCKPNGICGWNYFLEGDGHDATLEFHWAGEQGNIVADETPFAVCKHGVFIGHWTLERNGEVVAAAQKTSAFCRSFEIECHGDSLLLCAESSFGRSFRVERSGDLLAQISPVHAFTRRATIETFREMWSFTAISFSFWLVVLTWRRAASNAAAGG